MKWKKGVTLSDKQKEFKWDYSARNGLTIIPDHKDGEKKVVFSNTDVNAIINYIKEKEKVALANNVEKLSNGTEKDGIGSFIYQNIFENTTHAQAASQLVSIFHNAGVLGYNGAARGMEFWVTDENWKEKLMLQMTEGRE